MRLVKYDGTAVHLREMVDSGWVYVNANLSYLFLDGVCYISINYSGNTGSKWTTLGRVPSQFKRDSKFALINEAGWGRVAFLCVKINGDVAIGGADEAVTVANNTVVVPITSV